ncbi:MAG TPA: GTPase Era [Polyangia bacterium]
MSGTNDSTDDGTTTRAGFCAIIGRPNVGKSTLLNCFLGEKLATVTPKPQTTRNRILGVKNVPGAQIVFLDTPGVHRGKSELNRYMVEEAFRAMSEVDVVMVMVEVPQVAGEDLVAKPFDPGPGNQLIIDKLAEVKRPAVLVLNKVDRLPNKNTLLPLIDGWRKLHAFADMIPISARDGDGVDAALAAVVPLLPPGPPLFPTEMLTDRAERFLAAELIREQVFLLLKEEVPYATAVSIEGWAEREPRAEVRIDALIHVERDSQKGIVIGRGGAMIKEIGTRARAEIGKLLGCPVHLKLFVKVDPDWSHNPSALKRLGYE